MSSPGASADHPLFARILPDEGSRVAAAVIMGLATLLTAYLAAQAQRKGSAPDALRGLQLRAYRAGEQLGQQITAAGVRLSLAASRAYDRATL